MQNQNLINTLILPPYLFGNEYLLREENPEQDNEDNKPIVPGRGRQRRRGRGRGY